MMFGFHGDGMYGHAEVERGVDPRDQKLGSGFFRHISVLPAGCR